MMVRILTLLHLSADVIVCLDACFSQKCNKTKGKDGQQGPPNHHPSSVFMSEADVKAVEDFVDGCQSRRPPQAQSSSAKYDGYKPGMSVPMSVLNRCNDSFVAADEKQEKASTQFFADTGLMALLCHHDQPLWTVNMTSASEKQHYAIALLQQLFKHIPRYMTMGVLYDVGCNLYCSCKKWGFWKSSS
jgi:hypothetical protein